MKQRNLQFGQNNEPTVKFRATRRTPTGVQPLDLTGKAVKCVVKLTRGTPDSEAKAVMGTVEGGVSVPTPTSGEILLHVSLASTDEPGRYFYHLDLIEGGKAVTVLFGVWFVREL